MYFQTDCESVSINKPEPDKTMAGSYKPLAFCDECGSLRLRDVTEQLQELFIKRFAKFTVCGICKRSLGESTFQDVKKSKSVEQNESDLLSTESQTVQQVDMCTLELHAESIDGGAENQEVNNKLCVKGEHKKRASNGRKEASNQYDSVHRMSKATKNQTKNNEVKDKLCQEIGEIKQEINATDASNVTGERKVNSGQFEPVETRTRMRLSTGALTTPNYLSITTTTEDDDSSVYNPDADGDDMSDGNEQKADVDLSQNIFKHERSHDDDDSDYNPEDDMSDDNEQNKDVDLSQYIVKHERSHDANELNKKRIEYLVPELQELLIPSDNPQQLFKCKFCSATFGGQMKFQRHVVNHTSKELITMPYVCPNCGKKSQTLAKCLQHKSRHHGNKQEIMYKCTYRGCKYSFTRSQSKYFRSHLQVHQGKKGFQCKYCGGGFMTKMQLIIHQSTHASNKETLRCRFCTKTFSHRVSLNVHEKNIHINATKFKCDQCSYTASKWCRFAKHKQTHVIKGPFVCETCTRSFKYKAALETHKRAQKCNPPGQLIKPVADIDISEVTKCLDSRVVGMMGKPRSKEMPFRCKHCSLKEFRMPFVFMKHLKKFHFEFYPEIDSVLKKAFICDQCNKGYGTMEHFQNHQLIHSNLKAFKCEHPGCSKSFNTKKILFSHRQIHEERKHVCSFCGFKFARRRKLVCHEQSVHMKMKPHLCSHCGRAFAQKSERKKHEERVHLKLKKAVCDSCGLSFAAKEDLKNHSRTHTGEKPYKCDQCDYRCARLDYLHKHQRTHTGEKPYRCEHCSMAFTDRTPLVVHMRKHHAHGDLQTEETVETTTKSISTAKVEESTSESETAVVFLQAGILLQSLQSL